MVISMIRSLVIVALFMFCSVARADAIHDVVILKEYISKHCKSKCVDVGKFYTAVVQYSKEYQIDPKEMIAIIRVESSFKPKATNGGSRGLTQALLRYHRHKFRTKNYYDVFENIRVGISIYADCRNRRKTLEGAWLCYNGGGDPRYRTKVRAAYNDVMKLKLRM